MGLDVRAYSRLRLERSIPYLPDNAGPSAIWIKPNPHFPGRADDLTLGVYRLNGSGTSFHFHAGSCGGYNDWRRKLATLQNVECSAVWAMKGQGPTFPFRELIDFADSDGVIGPKTARKLGNDFAKMKRAALSTFAGDDYFLELYDYFRAAFLIARHDGAVVFS